MNKLMLGVIAVATLAAAPAVAADLRPRPAPVYKSAPPPAPLFSWTGCYLGGNVGGAWAYKSVSDPTGVYFPFVPGQDLGHHNAGGFVGGGQVGCDYQIGNWVIGGQGMFDWSSFSGDNSQPANAFTYNQTRIPWITTATGRLGYTVLPNLLLYAKGGGAWVRDNYSSYNLAGTLATAGVTRSGWTAGAGFEQAFSGGWSWFAEYNYLNFGTNTVTFVSTANPAFTFPIDVQQDMHMIVVGVNYRFSAGRF